MNLRNIFVFVQVTILTHSNLYGALHWRGLINFVVIVFLWGLGGVDQSCILICTNVDIIRFLVVSQEYNAVFS